MVSRVAAALTVSALSLAACGGGSGDTTDATAAPVDSNDVAVTDASETTDPPPPDSALDAPVETDPPTTSPAEPAPVARCANAEGAAPGTQFVEVGCDAPHDAEYAGTVPAPAGAVPADDVELDLALTSACLDTVVDLLGEPLDDYGPEIAYTIESAVGEELSGDVDCWLRSPAVASLTGSLRDADLATVLGDWSTLGSLQVGECYRPAPENSGSIGVGTIEDCSTGEGDQFLGTITIDGGPFPGLDALFARGDEECLAVADEAGLEPIRDTVGAIAMSETEWTVLGIRDLMCMSYDSGGDAFCTRADPDSDSVRYDDQVPCDEPHDAEFAGYVNPPVDVLPEDAGEAVVLLRQACRDAVERLAGRDAAEPGFHVGFSATTGLGEPIVDDIECYAEGSGTDLLVALMATEGVEAAYGSGSIVADLEPGTCFVFLGDSVDIGEVTDCDTPGALMAIGRFDVDLGEYPGLDALRALRNDRCASILADSGLAVDPATVSGTIANSEIWEAFGARYITCDGVPS